MAATGGGKIRSRRSHIASKPYAKNKQQQTGLISRVTDTVKSIVPGWLQRYFNNEGGSPGAAVQGTEQNCEVTLPPNGSEEGPPPLDGRHSPEPSTSTAEPSTSRASLNFQEYVLSRPPLSRSHLHFPPMDVSSPALGTSTGLFSQPSTSSAPGPFSTGFSLVKEIKDNLSQHEHEDDNISTTSGFSSRASDKDVPNSKTASLPQLWSPETDRTNSGPQLSQASLKKPSFNLSVFGNSSNSTLNSTILNSSQLGDSPFYPGKTTYGGAGAVRSARSRPGTPYQAPVRRQIKAKPAGAQPCGVTSASARRILQSLERMSSPLADARRIPSTAASSVSVSLDGTNIEASPFQAKRKRMENLPPVQKLTVPSTAPLSTNRSVSFRPSLTPGAGSRTLDRTPRETPTRQSPQLPDMTSSLSTFVSGAQGYPLSSTPAASAVGSGGGKMKRERSTARPSSKRQDDDDEIAEAPDLPAISLPISSSALPTFTFSSPVPPPTTTASSPALTTLTGTSVKETNKLVNKESTIASTPPSVPFTFSSPIVKATAASPPSFSPTAGFTFSAPVAKLGPSMSNGNPSAPVSASVKPVTTKSTEEFEGPFKPAKTLKTGSVLDLLKDPGFSSPVTPKASAADVTSKTSTPSSTSTISSSSGLSDLFKPQPGWSCDVCLVRNKPTDTKCVCCSTPQPNTSSLKPSESKPSAPPSTGINSSSSVGFGTLFSKPAGTWDCDTCLVHNKPEAVKCVACETAKPGTGLTSSLTLPSAFSAVKTVSPSPEPISTGTIGFGDMFKPPEGSWKCDICMVQNKAEDSKCVACTTPKPAGVSGTTTTAPPVAVSSAAPSLASNTPVFSFGDKFKPPQGSWKCDTCMVQNKAEDSKCVACTTPKPGASGATTTAPPVAVSSAEPAASNTPMFGFEDKFKPPEGSWKCDTCMVQNKVEDSKCVACTTPKPGASGTTTTVPPVAASSAAPSLPSFADQFKKPEGSWKCDVCLLCNKADDVQCVACQTPKPGAKVEPKVFGTSFGSSATETSSSSPFGSSVSGGIKFGTTDSSSSGSGGFKFGGSFPDSSSTSSGFKFGTSFGSSSETKDTTASSGFKFGTSSEGFQFGTSSTDDKKSEQPAATSGFKFGNGSGINFGTGSSSTENGSSKGGFTFGLPKPEEKSTDSTSTPATVSFAPTAEKNDSPAPSTTGLSESSTSTITKPNTGSLFGSLATSGSVTFGSLSAEKETPAPTFSFGKPEEKKEGSTAPSAFIFGGASKDPAPAPAPASTGGFSFGKSSAPADQPAFTFGKPAKTDKSEASTTESSKPVFSFGQSAPDLTAAQKPAFSFMASNPTTNSTSSATSTPTASLFGNSNTSAPAAAPSPVPSTFVFGQPSSTTDPPQTKAFVFGQSQDSQPAAPSALNTTPAPAQPFIFGASGNTVSAAPSFNFGGAAPPAAASTAPSAAPSPFVFNSASSGSFVASQTPSFGSSFGSPFPAQSSQPPAFGANTNAAPVFGQTNSAPVFGAAANSTPAGGGFQFGGAGAFGASNTGSGVFTFGAGSASPAPSAAPAIAPQSGAAPGGFNFSQAPAFNIGSNKSFPSPGGQAIPGRRIRTAVRRRK